MIEEQKNNNEAASAAEKAERRLTTERAAQKEKSWSEQLRGKARTIVGGLMVMTAITMGEGVASAKDLSLDVEHGESVEEFEARENSQERAVAFLEKLMQARAREGITNPGQQRLMAQEAARAMIKHFAKKEKGLKEKIPANVEAVATFQDICDALDILNGASGEFADRHYKGNIGEAQKQMATNPGLHTFMEMFAQCR